METGWLVLLPPLLVLVTSFATHRMKLSLFLGIISATLIYHNFAILPALKTAGLQLLEVTEVKNLLSLEAFLSSSYLFIHIFLLLLGIVITLITATGGTQAYGNFIQKRLRDRKGAETSSLILSLLFFIDDYLNILTVGCVMPPITDRFKIPRIKLAFFVNAFAGALCILVPFSSWSAYILMTLDSAGVLPTITSETFIVSSSLMLFIKAIPFAFYPFIVIASTFFIVRKRISFGLMQKQEIIAQETGNVFGGRTEQAQQTSESCVTCKKEGVCSMVDFLLPIVLLVAAVFVGLWLTNFNAAPSLCMGALATLAITIPYFIVTKKLQINQLWPVCWDGINLMLSSLSTITLAWTFGEVLTNNLSTGQFIASNLLGSVGISFLPLLFFVVTTLTTVGIASAWSAMAITIPVAIPMLTSMHPGTPPIPLEAINIALPTISAIFSGAVIGNILTPVADLVVMGSTSTQSNHMDHVTSQQVYLMPIFAASCISFLLSGLLINLPLYLNALISLSVGLFTSFTLLLLLNRTKK